MREDRQMFSVVTHIGHRHLVRSKRALHLYAVYYIWPCPALGRAQHNRGPAWACRRGPISGALVPGLLLNLAYLAIADLQRLCKGLMHLNRISALHQRHVIAMPAQQRANILVTHASLHRRARDFIAIQMENWKHRAIACRVEKLDALPRTLQRTR